MKALVLPAPGGVGQVHTPQRPQEPAWLRANAESPAEKQLTTHGLVQGVGDCGAGTPNLPRGSLLTPEPCWLVCPS